MLELNSVFQGDCLELMNQLDDQSIDMVLCDLPYGRTHNKWDVALPFDALWKQYTRVCKKSAPILLFGDGMFMADLMESNKKMWRYNLVWDKVLMSGFLNANRMPLRRHEEICVFYQTLPVYNPQMTQGAVNHYKGTPKLSQNHNYGKFGWHESRKDGVKYPSSIIQISKPHPSVMLHPTEKPVALLEYLIKTYSNEGALVLDNTAGCGGTALACINTERKFIIMEKDPDYCKISGDRIKSLMEQKNQGIIKENAISE